MFIRDLGRVEPGSRHSIEVTKILVGFGLPAVVGKPSGNVGDLWIGIDNNQTCELVATEGLKKQPAGSEIARWK